MSEKWSEFAQRMADKEGWLAAHLEKEPEAGAGAPPGAGPDPGRLGREADSGGGRAPGCDAIGLYATASLVRGAVNAPEVPESAQSQSRAVGLAQLEQQYPLPEHSASSPSPSWLGQLGSWLQVAFNLFRRR